MDVTMAVGTDTADAAPSCAPTQFLFDAINEPSKKHLIEKWTASIKFC
jgi:hypothetical protein